MAAALCRRDFLQSSVAAAAVGAATASALARGATSANDKLAIGVMGLGRGSALATAVAALPDAEVTYLCDVDSRALARGLDLIGGKQPRKPLGVGDFRKILDDPAVDALVIAAPDHWHAPAAILACAAGKHVYVEKPCCQNPHEGELAIAAARKHDRVVQVGTQRRSWPGIIEAIDKVRSGAIGRVLYSRGWYANHRPSIGKGKLAPIPDWLDYSLWQGPAPERPFKDNYLHYNWHGFWHWGTGELGNNGVHALDVCRWGLGVDYPRRVVSGGGKYRYDDDQETPDTHTVTFDFGGKSILWEGLSWSPRGMEGETFGATFHGERGTMVINSGGYAAYDLMNKEIGKGTGPAGDQVHMADFVASVRAGRRPHADIEEGHKSSLLCHLGNIAYRVGRALDCDPQTGHILHDDDAMRLWAREYRPGWEPK
ncbi:MAG TPA: Gfo/Idh/MocA family oxidoreductase [Pirellulales bacterium]|nr:Gfo/Idh/MocA family oxidoreductase [Pirellulales bacterium]